MRKRGGISLKFSVCPPFLSMGTGHGASCVGRGLDSCAWARGTNGQGYRGGCCQDFSVIQWADKSSLDAWDPQPEWLKLGKQEEASSGSNYTT